MLCQFQVAQHLFNLTGASPQCAPNSGKYIGGQHRYRKRRKTRVGNSAIGASEKQD